MAYLLIELPKGNFWQVMDDLKAKIIAQGLDLATESYSKMDPDDDIDVFRLLRELKNSCYDHEKYEAICCHRNGGPGWKSYMYESLPREFAVGHPRLNHFLLDIEDDALAVQIKLACF